ncbi:type VI secretion protein IcmF/TssM N-terminal domain-containing protein, partial [Vibrio splendidus]
MIKKFVVALIAITLMIVSIAVWFVLPSDTWLWAQVTTSITTFVVLVVMAVWLSQWRNKQRANSDVHEQHVLLKQDTKVIQELFKLAAKKIRGHGTNKLESLYNLPWYIVLGGEKEAKSALLQQNGLEPVLDKHLQDSDSEQYLKFWSCDQAVVIEIGHRIFDSEGVDETLWRITAQQLLKYRPRQGLNGIAAVIGCDRLLQGDQKERQKLSSIYQEAALSMSGALGLSLPMYCLFSKADTIADFVEFFEGYSGCDVENPFGVTFPCEASRRFDKYKFEEMRKTLLKSMANQQFELLRNISSEKAGSIIALP